MIRINPNTAGVDIGAVKIVLCVGGVGDTQIVRAFRNYTMDLQTLGILLKDHGAETVAMNRLENNLVQAGIFDISLALSTDTEKSK